MLANSPISPTIPVVDLDRAKRFYETTLGLKPVPANNDITPLAQLRLNVAKALV
jgi:predicted enzyme related to lactoylglutathione lyase